MHIPQASGREPRPDGSGPPADAAGPAASAQAQAQALQREFDLFVGRVSHDLQSVLQNTEGFAAALLASAGDKLDARERHYLERIRHTVLRGNGLLHDMVGYWRLATQPLALARIEPGRVLERACERVQGASRVAIEWRRSGEWPGVHADAALLEHALVCLLGNAVKFSGDAAPVVVELAGSTDDSSWTLRITDHGVGFDPAETHRLFQPCSRLHAPPLAGHGMGLATVQRIAQRLGGSVGASGRPGVGAVFTLTLPLATAPSLDAPARAPGVRRRVLLIDDDPLVLSSLAAMAEHAGCEVTPAETGAAGLAAFERALAGARFDIVITDLGLPGLRGDDVARTIKQLSPTTGVLVVTGQAPEAVRQQLPEVDGVVGKPLRFAALRAALDAVAPPTD
jgi:CheY-like chemotaxis protein